MASGREQTEAQLTVQRAHDEVLFVIRKLQDRFARVV